MTPLHVSLMFTAAMALLSSNPAVQASPDNPGPCSKRLEQLGYTRAKIYNTHPNTALYEAYRGREEVKLIVDNESCRIQKTWLDD